MDSKLSGLLLTVAIFGIFSVSTTVFSEEKFPGNIPSSLALKIGERLYLSQKQGCATCHQVNGVGGAQAGAANLQTPSKWKSGL